MYKEALPNAIAVAAFLAEFQSRFFFNKKDGKKVIALLSPNVKTKAHSAIYLIEVSFMKYWQ